jgi:2-methylcitrate dehydratase
MLAAIVIGYEVYGRLKGLMDRSGPWDGVSLSAFVAPVIAGRLMGLDADRLAHALALSGIRAAAPALVRRGGISAAKSIANALVAQGAVEATLLAERGVTGPLAVLEHERGLRSVFPKGDVLDTLSAAFPERSYIMRSNVKVYPCLATGQAAVAAALEVHKSLGGNVDGVRDVEIVMADYPFVRDQQDDPDRIRPRSREAADHSFQYLVAVALMDGAFGPAQFDGERWLDPRTVALMAKIRTCVDATLNVRAPNTYPCVVLVRDEKGCEHVSEILSPPGTSRGGIVEKDVVDKFHSVAAALDRTKREDIVSAVLGLDRAASTDSLVAALRM